MRQMLRSIRKSTNAEIGRHTPPPPDDGVARMPGWQTELCAASETSPAAAGGHRVAVISDTHGLLRPEAAEVIRTCEAVFHAGDVGDVEVLRQLEGLLRGGASFVYAVRGNVDRDEALVRELPKERFVTLHGFRFYLVHDRADIPAERREADFIICGHSHRYEERRLSDGCAAGGGPCRFLNPGSCGPRRFRLPVTMVVLTLDEETHRAVTELLELDDAAGPARIAAETGNLPTGHALDRLIRKVIKQVDAGRTVADIAARCRIGEELAEEICRIYVTHPGVDVGGIIDRMERKNL